MPKLLTEKLFGLAAAAPITIGVSRQAQESPQDLANVGAPAGGEPE